MYKTIEAIYENGKITLLDAPLDIKKSRVLVTFIVSPDEPNGVKAEELSRAGGLFSHLPLDGLEYQRSLRNEW